MNRIGIRHGTYSSNHLDLLYEQISEKYEFAEIFQRVLDVQDPRERIERRLDLKNQCFHYSKMIIMFFLSTF